MAEVSAPPALAPAPDPVLAFAPSGLSNAGQAGRGIKSGLLCLPVGEAQYYVMCRNSWC